jgi:hypothetical protein
MYRVLMGKPETKRRRGIRRHTCQNGSEGSMCEGTDWIHLSQDRGKW